MAYHRVRDYQLVVHDKKRSYNFQGLGVRHPDAQIIIRTDDNYFIRVFFMPDGEELPDHYEGDISERVNLFLFSRQYTWSVDLLRNEGPQWIWWDGSNFFLTTGAEPAGAHDE